MRRRSRSRRAAAPSTRRTRAGPRSTWSIRSRAPSSRICSAAGRSRAARRSPWGRRRTGRRSCIGSKLYVPVRRGVAVVDIPSGKVETTIALPATPVSLVAGPNGNALRGALLGQPRRDDRPGEPGQGADARHGGQGPRRPRDRWRQASTSAGRIGHGSSQLDPKTGAPGRSREAALRPRPSPIRVGAPKITSAGQTVTVTIPLAGGSLPANGLVVKNTKISGGSASAQLWQGGIKTAGGTKSGSGVAVKTTAAPGHVVVGLGVRAGDFTKVAVKRGAGGHSVIFTLTQKPAPPPVTTTTPHGHHDDDADLHARPTTQTDTPTTTHDDPDATARRRRPTTPQPPRRRRPRRRRRPSPSASSSEASGV